MTIIFSAAIILIFISLAVAVGAYNRLVLLRNRYKNSYSQIDIQLKRRYDLIPNLVESTKAYLKHERETLDQVISHRNSASAANQTLAKDPSSESAMQSLLTAEGALSSSLSKLMAVVESYPDLKANQSISTLMEELSSTENRVAFSRQAYNDAVTLFNTARETFPESFIAATFHFNEAKLFEVEHVEERAAAKVAFG
jgi:LemA protein